MNWSSIASLLADAVDEPVLVVDDDGHIALVNERMETLLRTPREQLVGRALTEIIPHDDRDRIARLLGAALQGARRRGELTIAASENERWTMTVDLSLVRGPTEGAVLCRATAVRPAAASAPPLPCAWMEIKVGDDDFGRIVKVTGPEQLGDLGRHCYEVVVGAGAPCSDCPVARLDVGGTVADLQLLPDERILVRRGRRLTPDTAQIAHIVVGSGAVSHLLDARIRAIATRGGLSSREREVFEQLVLGRSLEEVAAILAISTRTVRFHQGNVLAKLGIDSRLELVRMLLD